MKMSNFLKAMLAVGIIAACFSGLAACSNNSGSSASDSVAATVNGTTIPESKVTDTVQNVRAQSSLEDEDSWGQFLVSNSMTPQSIREQIINSLVDQELIKEGAKELNITVESSEIDTYVEQMKANFDNDEAWKEALTQAGFTEEEYRESITTSLTQQKINEHFEQEAKVEKSDITEAAKTYAPYYDGAKRSSHILIGVDDTTDDKAMKEAREKAQDIISQIKSGEISFADAAKQYSTDTGSAEKGGDVGWDVLSSFVTEYTDALSGLKKGEISDPVESQYGIHIITVTNTYKAPEEVKSIKDLPKAFRSTIKDYAKSIKSNDDYTAWLDALREKADIQINEMPADVPYNIDLTKYQEEASSEAAASDEAAAEEGSDEAAASDEAASSEGAESTEESGDEAATDDATAASSEAAASGEAAEAESAASDEAASSDSSASADKAA